MIDPRLTSGHVDALLRTLCVDLGFCLPPDDHARLVSEPPSDIDVFTDEVFAVEGMDVSLHPRLRDQVRAIIAARFGATSGDDAAGNSADRGSGPN
jgi:hypothetical protein